jgi:hypothetical protein
VGALGGEHQRRYAPGAGNGPTAENFAAAACVRGRGSRNVHVCGKRARPSSVTTFKERRRVREMVAEVLAING